MGELAAPPSPGPLHPPWSSFLHPQGAVRSPVLPWGWGAGPSAPTGTPPYPLPPILQVNMVIGILVFNKLVSKDGITDKKLKERAG